MFLSLDTNFLWIFCQDCVVAGTQEKECCFSEEIVVRRMTFSVLRFAFICFLLFWVMKTGPAPALMPKCHESLIKVIKFSENKQSSSNTCSAGNYKLVWPRQNAHIKTSFLTKRGILCRFSETKKTTELSYRSGDLWLPINRPLASSLASQTEKVRGFPALVC